MRTHHRIRKLAPKQTLTERVNSFFPCTPPKAMSAAAASSFDAVAKPPPWAAIFSVAAADLEGTASRASMAKAKGRYGGGKVERGRRKKRKSEERPPSRRFPNLIRILTYVAPPLPPFLLSLKRVGHLFGGSFHSRSFSKASSGVRDSRERGSDRSRLGFRRHWLVRDAGGALGGALRRRIVARHVGLQVLD